MKSFNNIVLSLLLTFLLSVTSCNLFKTRQPEDPNTGQSSYHPPTSPDTVISNFINAILEKNSENYNLCFSDTSKSDKFNYYFISSSDASIYASLFQNWNIISEQRFFVSLITKISSDVQPEIIFSNSTYHFDVKTPDSAVFITDYYLHVEHNLPSVNKTFAGTLQFTITSNPKNGLWGIYRWTDSRPSSATDTVKATWSILKAQFSN